MKMYKFLFTLLLIFTTLGCGKPNASTLRDNCREVYGKELPLVVPNATKDFSPEEFNNFTLSIFLTYALCLENAASNGDKGPRL
ncbi:hypothetical protein [Leptospira vanthielii]|uniref:Lipoprotein n=1 Tax=Leptospira vanthielii TaxID=293085 RepID=A0ABY2NP78_9LEPT|nr:hypothetical protein [Leptospira vanthielii]TGM56894.1 hypothetical protein EHQ95_09700 [Leptospira vanthielii]